MLDEMLNRKLRELPLPAQLEGLIDSDNWVHPVDDVMRDAIPFLRESLIFLNTKEEMVFESGPMMELGEIENTFFPSIVALKLEKKTCLG